MSAQKSIFFKITLWVCLCGNSLHLARKEIVLTRRLLCSAFANPVWKITGTQQFVGRISTGITNTDKPEWVNSSSFCARLRDRIKRCCCLIYSKDRSEISPSSNNLLLSTNILCTNKCIRTVSKWGPSRVHRDVSCCQTLPTSLYFWKRVCEPMAKLFTVT